MQKKFELFGGCLGNGTTVCNKAVIENGDYKMIAHISNEGKIKWYIKNPESYVPADDMKIIHDWSESAHKKFMEDWNKLPDIVKYERIMGRFSAAWLLNHPMKEQLKSCTNLHEKILILEKIYFEECL